VLKLNQLKQLRIKNGLTLAELAKQAGVTSAYLCQLENGERGNPSFKLMVKLDEIFKQDNVQRFFQK
jgi:transcriptional regulator with XRE-family HTH domain